MLRKYLKIFIFAISTIFLIGVGVGSYYLYARIQTERTCNDFVTVYEQWMSKEKSGKKEVAGMLLSDYNTDYKKAERLLLASFSAWSRNDMRTAFKSLDEAETIANKWEKSVKNEKWECRIDKEKVYLLSKIAKEIKDRKKETQLILSSKEQIY